MSSNKAFVPCPAMISRNPSICGPEWRGTLNARYMDCIQPRSRNTSTVIESRSISRPWYHEVAAGFLPRITPHDLCRGPMKDITKLARSDLEKAMGTYEAAHITVRITRRYYILEGRPDLAGPTLPLYLCSLT